MSYLHVFLVYIEYSIGPPLLKGQNFQCIFRAWEMWQILVIFKFIVLYFNNLFLSGAYKLYKSGGFVLYRERIHNLLGLLFSEAFISVDKVLFGLKITCFLC